MIDLRSLSYPDFGRLRFLDFFPETDAYFNDDVGGTTCGIGLACVDGYGFTGFASRTDSPGETAEISINFEDCPVPEGEAFLRFMGLNLRRGLTREEILAIMGQPEREDCDKLRFVIGTRWPYYVGCGILRKGGLENIWICRKDLADDEAKRMNSM